MNLYGGKTVNQLRLSFVEFESSVNLYGGKTQR